MNAVFTIVAQNYIAQATTLHDSIKQLNPSLDVFIFIVGATDKIDRTGEGRNIVAVSDLGIPPLMDMAFKYDVTELCTAVKPHCFLHLMDTLGYERVIYFDPDIYVYHDLHIIYDMLDGADMVVTPHILFPEIHYTGAIPEGLLLFVGIYNLGFLAVKKTALSASILQWWKTRLETLCYADKIDGLHVDQKWVEFLPVFCGNGLLISKHMGMNVSIWNLHERRLIMKDGRYHIEKRTGPGDADPLVFYHFAKFDPKNSDIIHKDYRSIARKAYDEYSGLYADYGKLMRENRHDEFVKIPYTYNYFSNGKAIVKFQRRLYRRLSEMGFRYTDAFSTEAGSFYSELEADNLIGDTITSIDGLNEREYEGFDRKIRALNMLFILLKNIVGGRRYIMLMKLLLRYCRPENQVFLLSKFRRDYVFKNENQ